MRHLDIASGFGGFALAVEYVYGHEWDLHCFVEIDKFCQSWLKANWPGCRIHDDMRTYKHDGSPIDLVSGGPPCQPVSIAGKRQGDEDDRWLWPEMLRIIQESRPRWVIFENVYNLVGFERSVLFEGIISDLETAGYDVIPPFVLPASSQNAPHRRYRVFIMAYAKGDIWRPSGHETRKTSDRSGADESVDDALFQGLEGHAGSRKNKRGQSGEPEILPAGSTPQAGIQSRSVEDAGGIRGRRRHQENNPRNGQSLQAPGSDTPRAVPNPINAGNPPSRNRIERQEQAEIQGRIRSPLTEPGRYDRAVDDAEGSEWWRVLREDNARRRFMETGGSGRNWDGAEWIIGRDGKARRFKPGIRFVVDGFPYRNDLLRGFGNAIVPQVIIPLIRAIKENGGI